MEKNKIYRHSNPYSSCDIKILNIIHENDIRIKAKILYLSKVSGLPLSIDTVKILKKDLPYWEEINHRTETLPA